MNRDHYRAVCTCGATPPPGEVERSYRSPTADRGWVVVKHECLCGRRTRFAHDTQGVIEALDRKAAA